MRCFVTVGTTEFDALIEAALCETSCQALKKLGITEVLVQCGRGVYGPRTLFNENGGFVLINGLKVIAYSYKKDLQKDMESSQLIVGHAGAGTCLEALSFAKPFIAVINSALMGNHQRELADRLTSLGCIISTTPEQLPSTLSNFSLNTLNPFFPTNLAKLASEIDVLIGFEKSKKSNS